MSIKINTSQLGCITDCIVIGYGEEGSVDLRIASDGKLVDVPLSIGEARELAAALYGLAHLA